MSLPLPYLFFGAIGKASEYKGGFKHTAKIAQSWIKPIIPVLILVFIILALGAKVWEKWGY